VRARDDQRERRRSGEDAMFTDHESLLD
jgi:hypothetical protein